MKVGERQFTESDVENELFTKFLSSKLLQYPLIFLQNFFSHPVYRAEHKLKKKIQYFSNPLVNPKKNG